MNVQKIIFVVKTLSVKILWVVFHALAKKITLKREAIVNVSIFCFTKFDA